MKKGVIILLALGALAIGNMGCSGSGPTTASINSLSGSFTGNWNSPTSGQNGVTTINIYVDGTINGTMTLANLSQTGQFVGKTDTNGHFKASVGFGALGNYYLDGNMSSISGNNVAQFTVDTNGGEFSAQWTIKPQGSGSTGG